MTGNRRSSACPEREPALEEYLFGQMDCERRDDLERHLEICGECRQALDEARAGFSALEYLEESPLPFGNATAHTVGGGTSVETWVEFLERIVPGHLRKHSKGKRWLRYRYSAAAAAALLLAGVGIGHWFLPLQQAGNRTVTFNQSEEVAGFGVEQEAVDALARAELLADLGVPYVEGLLELAAGIMSIDFEQQLTGGYESTRSKARKLLQDGRLLRRRLDPERDQTLLATINKAELILEEIAALESAAESNRDLIAIQEVLRISRLEDRLVTLDMDSAISTALLESGWIGEEYIQKREVRR